MGEFEKNIAENQSAEAIQATKLAAEAVEKARAAQLAAAVTLSEERMSIIVRHQIENVLALGSEKDKSIILARVPYICQDIRTINDRGGRIESGLMDLNKAFALLQQRSDMTSKIVYGAAGIILIAFLGGLTTLVFMHK